MLVLVGCSDSNTITGPGKDEFKGFPVVEDVVSIKEFSSSKAVSFPIMIDKDELVGTVSVQNDQDYLYLTFSALKDWAFAETNVHIAADLRGIPQSRDGYPSPHDYAYMDRHKDNVKAYTVKIPLSDHSFRMGQEIIIAANFMLMDTANISDKGKLVIGWGGSINGPGHDWWNYITYTLKPDKNSGGGDNINDIIVLDKTIEPVIE